MDATGSIAIVLWPRTHDLSLVSFVCPPEIVRFTIVICVPRDWLKSSYCRSSNLCHQYCFLAFVGVYYSLSCEPTLSENQIFHSVVKRQVMKTRDAIKLIGDGQGQKLKKNKVIESWIKEDIGTRWQKEKLMSSLRKTVSQLKDFFCFCFVFLHAN